VVVGKLFEFPHVFDGSSQLFLGVFELRLRFGDLVLQLRIS
jgi:hypothetical protein